MSAPGPAEPAAPRADPGRPASPDLPGTAPRRRRWPLVVAAAFLLVFWLESASLFTVNQMEQVLVIRLGAPQRLVTKPGLDAKLPFVDSLVYYDRRLLTLDPPVEQVILGDQKRLEVQPFTRYRIDDPLTFYQSLRTLDQAAPQINQVVTSALRRRLGQVALPALLSPDRDRIVQEIQDDVAARVKPWGIHVEDVRLHRADLPRAASQAIYDRMKSERQREAKELRAQGFEWAQKIESNSDRERTIILSDAERQAKIVRGQADAQANDILAEAFDKDPRFYRLYRSLQTYRQALAASNPTLLLSPDAEFMRFFTAVPAPGGPAPAERPGIGSAGKGGAKR
ncbi:MAG: protease modulator HflC [Burkholderiales bacterium]|nr:protease modulator HflC [Burkholderiales bacterium]